MTISTSKAWTMLTTRALQYDGTAGGFGGLRQADVAAMLGGLNRRSLLAGKFLEAGDWSCLEELESALFMEIIELAMEKKWDLRQDGLQHCRSLGHLALCEQAGPATICPKCEGAGVLSPHGGRGTQCDRCDGRRKLPLTQKTRAELIGISESNWTRVWSYRYANVDAILDYWVAEANRHLRRALRATGHEIDWEQIRRYRLANLAA